MDLSLKEIKEDSMLVHKELLKKLNQGTKAEYEKGLQEVKTIWEEGYDSDENDIIRNKLFIVH